MVILKATNPKTKQLISLPPFKLPPLHKHLADAPTPVEARHFAATYALFRVCSMRNIHMMLPPSSRDLWKGVFQDLKNEDVKDGRGWMYEADPFLALQEREAAKAVMARKRDDREKQRAKDAAMPGGIGGGGPSSGAGFGGAAIGNALKGWSRIPKIEMGKRTRVQIEALIRRNAVWNPHALQLSPERRSAIVEDLSRLGFRNSHIKEAVLQCKDREETLEWLLIHVPEDDLPQWSLPEGYVAGISLASGDLKRESVVKRLAAAGYATELCDKVLRESDGDEGRAAEKLQHILMQDEGIDLD